MLPGDDADCIASTLGMLFDMRLRLKYSIARGISFRGGCADVKQIEDSEFLKMCYRQVLTLAFNDLVKISRFLLT